jgi:hypothetical protein
MIPAVELLQLMMTTEDLTAQEFEGVKKSGDTPAVVNRLNDLRN